MTEQSEKLFGKVGKEQARYNIDLAVPSEFLLTEEGQLTESDIFFWSSGTSERREICVGSPSRINSSAV